MRNSNGKLNKMLVGGIVFYCIMILDILINTIIAHISNTGMSRITNAIMLGPIVFNPISVFSAFIVGTVLTLIGLIFRSINRKH